MSGGGRIRERSRRGEGKEGGERGSGSGRKGDGWVTGGEFERRRRSGNQKRKGRRMGVGGQERTEGTESSRSRGRGSGVCVRKREDERTAL